MGRVGYYKKSRNGCQRCKMRRVKCDEETPCSACEKHGLPCSLQDAAKSASPPLGRAVRLETTQRRRERRNHSPRRAMEKGGRSRSLPLLLEAYPSQLPPIEADPWIQDLELMHHYTTNTYASFPTTQSAQAVFKQIIPQVAFRFPYLLHSVLAISAFHLAHLNPEQRQEYKIQATRHQTKSISGIREALAGEFNEKNAYPLLSASSFIMGGAFASDACDKHVVQYTCPLAGMLEIVSLLKGMTAIQTQAFALLNQDLVDTLQDSTPVANTYESPTLAHCSAELMKLKEKVLERQAADPILKDVLVGAADDLFRAMRRTAGPKIVPTAELSVVFTWPAQVSDAYIALLHERHPSALAVFLIYCVMLQSMEERAWILKGWGANLAAVISELLVESPWVEWKALSLERMQVS